MVEMKQYSCKRIAIHTLGGETDDKQKFGIMTRVMQYADKAKTKLPLPFHVKIDKWLQKSQAIAAYESMTSTKLTI